MKPLSTSGLPARNHLTAKNVPANEVVVQDVLEGAERTAPQADVFMSLVLGGEPKQDYCCRKTASPQTITKMGPSDKHHDT